MLSKAKSLRFSGNQPPKKLLNRFKTVQIPLEVELLDKVVHFEIPADDLARAKKFYKSMFGWELEDYPGMEYTVVRTVAVDKKRVPKEKGAINGGIFRRNPEQSVSTVVINVPSLDSYLTKVMAAGGKIVRPKQNMGEMGWYALVSDTEGNTIGLWQDMPKPGRQNASKTKKRKKK